MVRFVRDLSFLPSSRVVPPYDLVVPPYNLVAPPSDLVVPPYNLVVPHYNLVVPPSEHPGPVRDLALTRLISHRARSGKTEGQGRIAAQPEDDVSSDLNICRFLLRRHDGDLT